MLDEYEEDPRSVREQLRNHQQEQTALRKKEKDRDRYILEQNLIKGRC